MSSREERSIQKGAQEGAVLALVLMIVAILSSLATAMSVLVRVDVMQQNAQESVARNFLAAEAGVSRGMAEFRNLFLDLATPSGSDFDPRDFVIDGHDVRYQLRELLPPPGAPYPEQLTLPAGNAFAGLQSLRYQYNVESEDLHPDGSPRAQLAGQFDVHNVPIFQFLFFYADDLEFLYPAPMDLHGRIHTNGNLYLNAGSTLTIGDSADIPMVQVSAAGSIWRGEPPDATGTYTGCAGTLTIDKLEDADNDGLMDPLEVPCNGSSSREITQAEAADWLGSLLPGLGNVTPPSLDEIRRGDGTFWEKADVRIVLDTSSSMVLHDTSCSGMSRSAIEVQNANGSRNTTLTDRLRAFMFANPGKIFYNDVPSCSTRDTTCASSAGSYGPGFADASFVYRPTGDTGWVDSVGRCEYRRGGFFNNREKSNPQSIPPPATLAGQGAWIWMLNVDLQFLLDWNRAQGAANGLFDPNDTTDGGPVIFLSVEGPHSSSVNNYGVRVFDSAALGFTIGTDPTGVTVVSDQAMYVEGNYNVIDKAPSALIGDSVNVLSSGWAGNDQRSLLPLASRGAAATTINAAFLAGIDRSNPAAGDRNGGVNNYPRFHEPWGGLALDYRGSMVNLGPPRHVNGTFCGVGSTCDIYTAPTRNWDYDPDFDDARLLPPLTPRVVWVEQTLFTQEFR